MAAALLAVGLPIVSGCGSEGEGTARAGARTSIVTKGSTSRLTGTWRRVNSCPTLARMFRDAELGGLLREWLVGGGYFDRPEEIAHAHPCRGAREVERSHSFTAGGDFGSYDETGRLVDKGEYEIVDDTTLAFPSHERELGAEVTVHYRVEADKLAFAVIVPSPCHGACRMATAWAISAFHPGVFERTAPP